MEVIALQASSERGKTPTIGLVREMFRADSRFRETHFEALPFGDFVSIFESDNMKSGLAPQGDWPDRLAAYLHFLANEGCKKAVVAVRTKGRTVQVVSKYKHMLLKKTIVLSKGPAEEAVANKADAEKIFYFLTQP